MKNESYYLYTSSVPHQYCELSQYRYFKLDTDTQENTQYHVQYHREKFNPNKISIFKIRFRFLSFYELFI